MADHTCTIQIAHRAYQGLFKWIEGRQGLIVINIMSHVRVKIESSLCNISCKGDLKVLKKMQGMSASIFSIIKDACGPTLHV